MSEKEQKLFDEIFIEFHPLLLRFGNKFFSDERIIEDCIQDLFVYIYEKEIKLSEIINQKAYLYKSFRRLLLQKKKVNNFDYTTEADTIVHFDSDEFVLNGLSSQQESERIINLLNGLPWRQREAIYLKYFNKLSAKEVAEIMGIQPQVVANMIYKALKKMRGSINNPLTILALSIPSIIF